MTRLSLAPRPLVGIRSFYGLSWRAPPAMRRYEERSVDGHQGVEDNLCELADGMQHGQSRRSRRYARPAAR